MNTLNIADLGLSQDLDREALATVIGGAGYYDGGPYAVSYATAAGAATTTAKCWRTSTTPAGRNISRRFAGRARARSTSTATGTTTGPNPPIGTGTETEALGPPFSFVRVVLHNARRSRRIGNGCLARKQANALVLRGRAAKDRVKELVHRKGAAKDRIKEQRGQNGDPRCDHVGAGAEAHLWTLLTILFPLCGLSRLFSDETCRYP